VVRIREINPSEDEKQAFQSFPIPENKWSDIIIDCKSSAERQIDAMRLLQQLESRVVTRGKYRGYSVVSLLMDEKYCYWLQESYPNNEFMTFRQNKNLMDYMKNTRRCKYYSMNMLLNSYESPVHSHAKRTVFEWIQRDGFLRTVGDNVDVYEEYKYHRCKEEGDDDCNGMRCNNVVVFDVAIVDSRKEIISAVEIRHFHPIDETKRNKLTNWFPQHVQVYEVCASWVNKQVTIPSMEHFRLNSVDIMAVRQY
jgi:hypothetical protein